MYMYLIPALHKNTIHYNTQSWYMTTCTCTCTCMWTSGNSAVVSTVGREKANSSASLLPRFFPFFPFLPLFLEYSFIVGVSDSKKNDKCNF